MTSCTTLCTCSDSLCYVSPAGIVFLPIINSPNYLKQGLVLFYGKSFFFFSQDLKINPITSPFPPLPPFKFQYNLLVNSFLSECRFHDRNPRFDFTCLSCVTYFRATQIIEIFHILKMFLIYQNLYWELTVVLRFSLH
jgi:hypothetical protein